MPCSMVLICYSFRKREISSLRLASESFFDYFAFEFHLMNIYEMRQLDLIYVNLFIFVQFFQLKFIQVVLILKKKFLQYVLFNKKL